MPCLVLALIRWLSSVFKVYSKAKGECLVQNWYELRERLGPLAFCIPTICSASDTCDTSFNKDLLKKGLGTC